MRNQYCKIWYNIISVITNTIFPCTARTFGTIPPHYQVFENKSNVTLYMDPILTIIDQSQFWTKHKDFVEYYGDIKE